MNAHPVSKHNIYGRIHASFEQSARKERAWSVILFSEGAFSLQSITNFVACRAGDSVRWNRRRLQNTPREGKDAASH